MLGADGRWRLRGGLAREDVHESKSTPQSTQVRGPREEVKPLLLPLTLCISLCYRVTPLCVSLCYRVTMVLPERSPGCDPSLNRSEDTGCPPALSSLFFLSL